VVVDVVAGAKGVAMDYIIYTKQAQQQIKQNNKGGHQPPP
jgi:hypothetical protein